MLNAAALDPTVAVAAVAGALALASTVVSLRSRGYPDLVDDIMADRGLLRGEVQLMRDEINALKLQARETEAALIECKLSEASLKKRVTELEELSR